jgi:anti-sigma factor RsiW
MGMDCTSTRDLLHDLRRGRLDPARAAEVRAHLAGCAACRHEEQAEALLDEALSQRLPRAAAPLALRRRVEDLAAASRSSPAAVALPRRAPVLRRMAVPAAFAAMALLAAGALIQDRIRARGGAADRLTDELVTDHLRLLVSAHPNDLESGLHHEVKPWFEGRLDFAPVVPGDRGELRLLGGAVGYVLDRKAAVMSYALRRHRVTLLAFPAAGLGWPGPNRSPGGVAATWTSHRGFEVVLWRAGDLAYALVSDVSAKELESIAAQLAPETQG